MMRNFFITALFLLFFIPTSQAQLPNFWGFDCINGEVIKNPDGSGHIFFDGLLAQKGNTKIYFYKPFDVSVFTKHITIQDQRGHTLTVAVRLSDYSSVQDMLSDIQECFITQTTGTGGGDTVLGLAYAGGTVTLTTDAGSFTTTVNDGNVPTSIAHIIGGITYPAGTVTDTILANIIDELGAGVDSVTYSGDTLYLHTTAGILQTPIHAGNIETSVPHTIGATTYPVGTPVDTILKHIDDAQPETITQAGHSFNAATLTTQCAIPAYINAAGALQPADNGALGTAATVHIIAIDGDDLTFVESTIVPCTHAQTMGQTYWLDAAGAVTLTQPTTGVCQELYYYGNGFLSIVNSMPVTCNQLTYNILNDTIADADGDTYIYSGEGGVDTLNFVVDGVEVGQVTWAVPTTIPKWTFGGIVDPLVFAYTPTDTATMNTISPVEGWTIYQNPDDNIYRYDGTKWILVGGGAGNTSVLTDNTNGTYTHNDGTGTTVTINTQNTAAAMNAGAYEITDGAGTLSTQLISTDALNALTPGTDGALYVAPGVETTTTITNTKAGNRIATYTNEATTAVDIFETITTLTNTGSIFTYVSEDGTSTSWDTLDATTVTDINNGLDITETADAISVAPDFTELTTYTPDGIDIAMIYDVSAGTHKGVTMTDLAPVQTVTDQANGADLLLTGSDLTFDYDFTELAVMPMLDRSNDRFIVYDVSTGAYEYTVADSLGRPIAVKDQANGLDIVEVADSITIAPDFSELVVIPEPLDNTIDRFMVWNSSDGTHYFVPVDSIATGHPIDSTGLAAAGASAVWIPNATGDSIVIGTASGINIDTVGLASWIAGDSLHAMQFNPVADTLVAINIDTLREIIFSNGSLLGTATNKLGIDTSGTDPVLYANHQGTWEAVNGSGCCYGTNDPTQDSLILPNDNTQVGQQGSGFIYKNIIYTSGLGSINNPFGDQGTQYNYQAVPVIDPPATGFNELAYNYYNAYALSPAGEVYSWGAGANGILGHGSTANVGWPTRIESLVTGGIAIDSVIVGTVHNTGANGVTLFLASDGSVWGTGQNNFGGLGLGNTTQQTTPQQALLPGGTVIEKLVLSGNYISSAYAVDNTGQLYVWGANGAGQLGLGNTTQQNTPVAVAGFTDVVDVKAAAYEGNLNWASALVLRADGTVWSAGYNAQGVLGVGNTTQQNSWTQEALGKTDWTQIHISSSSNGTSMAVDALGDVYVTGYNGYGQVGNGLTANVTSFTKPTVDDVGAPLAFQGKVDFIGHAGASTTTTMYVVDTDGKMYTSGYNGDGLRARGNTTSGNLAGEMRYWQPAAVPCSGCKIVDVQPNGWNLNTGFVVKTDDGRLLGSGNNTNGELGLSNTIARMTGFTELYWRTRR